MKDIAVLEVEVLDSECVPTIPERHTTPGRTRTLIGDVVRVGVGSPVRQLVIGPEWGEA